MSQGYIAPGRAAAVVASRSKPVTRPLQIYAFDPSLGRRHGNISRVSVTYEPLVVGPRGSLVEVIDYDASNDCYYMPVDLDSREILLQGGLPPTESDPQFHQQMVYAVAMRTIDTFSGALGRRMRWSGRRRGSTADHPRPLRVFPHALQDANAYYDSRRHALLFGYFNASGSDVGANLPGQTVFSCLSHDIVAHETTHALVHDLRRFFMKPTNRDTLAFHEAFADIVALFQHFTFRDALVEHVLRTGGALFRPDLAPILPRGQAPSTLSTPTSGRPTTIAEEAQRNVLVGLARQFGEAMGLRASLRDALGMPPDPAVLDRLYEVHERGSILVAAVFDAFFSVYAQRISDLLRIARVGAGGGELTIDLANRLASEATKTARQFGNMCIRALDYCPPVDITFGDFLRALITADFDLVADDDLGYRDILIEAFRRRGIRPDDVASFSESSLRWQPPEGKPLVCEGLSFDVIGHTDPVILAANARRLHEFASQNRAALNLKPAGADGLPKLAVESFHPASRVGPDGQLGYQIVAEIVQQESVAGSATPSGWEYHGGTTLILDAATGRVEYAVYKRLESNNRKERQLQFLAEWRGAARDAYSPPSLDDVDFAAVHRGC